MIGIIFTILSLLSILGILGLLFRFIKNFDKNRYYFMPLYTPSPEYWYPEWETNMAVHHTFKNTYIDTYTTLHGYTSRPVKHILPSDIIILYLHGNAGNVYLRIPHFQDIVRRLDDVYSDGNGGTTEIREHVLIAFDYRGFGLSSGSPTAEGILEDGYQMWAWCKSKFPQNKIILYGESIGTSVVSHMASRTNPNGIILKSPFSSMHSLVADLFHLRGILREIPKRIIPDDFLTEKWLEFAYNDVRIEFRQGQRSRCKKPEMVILHNKNDELIPTRNIRALLDKYKSFPLEGGHNDCPLDGAWLEGVCYVLDRI
jgi:pimeloyl-ACP methyl ester carboxylesterase